MLGRSVGNNLLRRQLVGRDLAVLGQLVTRRKPKSNAFRSRVVHLVSRKVQRTSAVAVDWHPAKGLEAGLHHGLQR